MNRKALAALILGTLLAFGAAGCSKADHRVPASRYAFAPCPAGDAGRIQDKWLPWPNQWVCDK